MSRIEHQELQSMNCEISEEKVRVEEKVIFEEFKEMLNEAFKFINERIGDDLLVHEVLKESFNDNFNDYDFKITDLQHILKKQTNNILAQLNYTSKDLENKTFEEQIKIIASQKDEFLNELLLKVIGKAK